MRFHFYKYHGNGNDFVIFDDRRKDVFLCHDYIKNLCSRRFGIGADGVMLLQNSTTADYLMKIFNSDGSEADMCGNGLGCIAKFVFDNIEKDKKKLTFQTKAGAYEVFSEGKKIMFKSFFPKFVSEKNQILLGSKKLEVAILNSGVMHGVIFVKDLDNIDVFSLGKKIRHLPNFSPGINVNFCEEIAPGKVRIRTFEKGVEAETLCCSTGALASSYAYFAKNNFSQSSICLYFPGGEINVFKSKDSMLLFQNPKFVFEGCINCFDKKIC